MKNKYCFHLDIQVKNLKILKIPHKTNKREKVKELFTYKNVISKLCFCFIIKSTNFHL